MNAPATAIARPSPRLPVKTALTTPVRAAGTLMLSLHHDLAALRDSWVAFEETADGTVFQTYEWLMPPITISSARRAARSPALPSPVRAMAR